jgi:hypothetical protein
MSAICHSSICVRDNDEFQEKRMALDKEAAKKVLAEIDRNELAQLGCDLTSIPSPTGKEKAITEFILTWFATNGLKAVRQDVEVDRPNAVGILKGDGTGLSLGFNGHTDTSFTGTGEDLRMVGNIEPEADLKGRIVGNRVQGLGISHSLFSTLIRRINARKSAAIFGRPPRFRDFQRQ